MALTGVKRDGNVPFIGPRARYNTLGVSPTWHYHKMGAGAALDGTAPRTATTAENDLDPAVSAGKAEWASLTKGGLFTMLGKAGKAVIVEAVDLSAGASLTVVNAAGATLRATPTAPFKLAPGEFLKASGGSNGGYAGVLVRLEGERIF